MNIFIDKTFSDCYAKRPLVLADIGARGGLQKNWKKAKKYLNIIGFEPDEKEYKRLLKLWPQKGNIYLNTLLYDKETEVDFYLTKDKGVSSLFYPNREFLDIFPCADRYDIDKVVKIKTDTLDNQIQKNKIGDIDFIKLDTQGSELAILEGAAKTINDFVFGIEIEVEFVSIYEGQPLFSDVDILMRSSGFSLFDIRSFYWKRKAGKNYGRPKGQIIFADALYLRNIDGLKYILAQIKDPFFRKTKILKALSICIIYGYLDYVLEVFECYNELFNDNEKRLFAEKIKGQRLLANKISNFRGRGRIADALFDLSKIIHPNGRGSACCERVLGNLE